MTDRNTRMVMRLLTIAWAPAYISGDEVLARLISAAMVRSSLAYGNTEDSAYGYVTHAITIGPVRKDYRAAYEWGELALKVNGRFDDVKHRAKIHQQFQAHVNLWRRPFDTCIPHAREAYRSGVESGDFAYAGYGAATEAWSAWLVSRDLDRFVREFTPTLAVLEKVKMTDFLVAHRIMLNWAGALQGRTQSRLSLSDATFDEQRFVQAYTKIAPFFLMFVYTAKLHVCVLFGAYADALTCAVRAKEVAPTGTIWPVLIDFWGSLAVSALCEGASADERVGYSNQLATVEQSMAELADACPENFRCFSLLISAERRRIASDIGHAVRLYDEAIGYARLTNNLQQEALANELCASEAYRCYAAWGATAKLAHMEEHYAHLLPTPRRSAVTAQAGVGQNTVVGSPAFVDIATVLKVAHAVAVEIEVGGLLRQLMKLALENAGARRGVFAHEAQGILVIGAEAHADRELVDVGQSIPLDEASGLAVAVIRYVHRTGQDVVIGNAATDERFAGDPQVAQSGAKSILCVPVGHQGRLAGILYLENNLTADAFTPDRIEVMRVLAAQTAISLENARLYDDTKKLYEGMKGEVERRTVAERALRDALSEVEALKNRLEAENVYLQEEIRTQHNFDEIIGNSAALLDVLRKIERVAPLDSTVLIVGETGSGKELFARAVHSRSRRRDRPLVNRPGPGRKRTLRPRQRGVHRRDREARRPLRARQRRHDLSR